MRRLDYGFILIERLKLAPNKENFLDVRIVSEEFKLSPAFLEKVAQELKRAGLIESRRGFGGGYRLAMEGAKIPTSRLIDIFEKRYKACPLIRNKKILTKHLV